MTFADTVDLVQSTMRDAGASAAIISKTVDELRAAQLAEKEERASHVAPKAKTQMVVISTAPGLGYVLQLDEAAPPQVAIDRIKAAANSFNDSKRGRKHPIKTVGEAMEGLKAKWLKSAVPSERTTIKTRTAVAILTVPNAL